MDWKIVKIFWIFLNLESVCLHNFFKLYNIVLFLKWGHHKAGWGYERHIHPLLSLHILYTHRHTPSHNQLMAKTVRLCVHTGPSLDRNPIKQLWFILIRSFFLQHKRGERGATEAGFLTAGVGHRPTARGQWSQCTGLPWAHWKEIESGGDWYRHHIATLHLSCACGWMHAFAGWDCISTKGFECSLTPCISCLSNLTSFWHVCPTLPPRPALSGDPSFLSSAEPVPGPSQFSGPR